MIKTDNLNKIYYLIESVCKVDRQLIKKSQESTSQKEANKR